MNILVLGSGGMLGHVTTIYLREKGHKVYDLSFPNKAFDDSFVCNVNDLDIFEQYLEDKNLDLIINCIALLIRDSEERKADAVWLNSYFPHWLEKKYANTRTKIVHVSTDGVFEGGKSPFSEEDQHLNTTFYARTKSIGELVNDKDLTVRSSYFGPDMNPNGKGLINWFLSQTGLVNGYSEVYFTGVTSLEFAKFIDEIAMNCSGTYNLGAIKKISKYELLKVMVEKLNISDIQLSKQDETKSDICVCSTRNDIPYKMKSYELMLEEMIDFMKEHKDLYPHYRML